MMFMKTHSAKLIAIGLLISALLPFFMADYLTLLSYIWVMILLALSWDIIGGQMGYNSFGNIIFFGIGMYSCALVQREMYSVGVGTFDSVADQIPTVMTNSEYFISLATGTLLGAIVAVILAIILGSGILGMRGHYFAICTLGLGIAAGEIASGIDYIGAGSGMVTPLYPETAGSKEFFYYYFFFIFAVVAFVSLKKVYASRFGLAINAIRDDEDKAEAMGLHTTKYKIVAWALSAFFLAITGAGVGNLIGFIDPIEVAFAGSSFGVWMILMAILGGKGRLWGPVLGALVFYITKEFFWTYLLGWQRVALGLLMVVIVVYFPTGILGWIDERWPSNQKATEEAQ